jgi:hypothetical protein
MVQIMMIILMTRTNVCMSFSNVVWEYVEVTTFVCMYVCVSVYVLSFVGKIRKMCQLFSSSNHLHTCTHTFILIKRPTTANVSFTDQ